MTDERALKLARDVVVNHFESPGLRGLYRSGEMDEGDHVQIALAAIKLTTKLAAEYAHAHAHFGVKAGLLRFKHLPVDGGENVGQR